MKPFRFICKDWVLGILLTLLVLGAFSLELFPLARLDDLAYDAMSRRKSHSAPRDVVVVAIDDKSIKRVGSWPWPRSYLADMLDVLSGYGPGVIGVEVLYPEKEPNPFLAEIREAADMLKNAGGRREKKAYRTLRAVEKRINGDERLLSSVKASGRVVFPMLFSAGHRPGGGGKISRYLKRNSIVIETPSIGLKSVKADLLDLKNPLMPLLYGKREAADVTMPFPELAAASRALGHLNRGWTGGDTVRREALLIPYRGRLYPSFPLQVALTLFGLDVSSLGNVEVSGGIPGFKLKETLIPADSNYRMLPDFSKKSNVPLFSFVDVMDGTVPGKKFKGKAVLIGYTGSGTSRYGTPSGESLTGVEVTANVVGSILGGNHIRRPAWAFAAEILVILYFGLFVSFVLPRVKLRVGAMLIVLSILPAYVAGVFLFFSSAYRVKLFSPGLLLVVGYLVFAARGHVSFGKKSAAEADSIESNKMLGLSFQNQGMLDLALEKFMKCPVGDASVRGLLYNLALDFERKRMPEKAKAIYEHILKAGRYRDVKKRAKKIQEAGETASLNPAMSGRGNTVLKGGTGENPTLGRYEIIRELGRGSMGMVFLGRDPKINRQVAIKTLVYGDVESEQLAEVKKRFFQEAEAAGRLSHPGIMTIYDAGEEHDMAYMAMELIQGTDLRAFCTRGNLLPIKEVMRIIAEVADALDYAHKSGVIHRDIKPANIMLLGNGTVKVTDFGIARIVEHSTTHTKMIQGTPSYMSPEQVNGERVAGPSDLFSLGSVSYELLSGKKAFPGENVSSIMHSISKGEFLPLQKVAKKVPAPLESIVKKLLAKNVKRRYRRGGEVSRDIRKFLGKQT